MSFNMHPISRAGYSREKLADEFVNSIIRTHPHLNKDSKARIFSELNRQESIDKIAKAITHFAFRNGPIETMHSNKQLSQADMKTLNKFTVNRLAYLVELILSDRWAEFETTIEGYSMYGTAWDEAIPDDGGMSEYIKSRLLQNASLAK